MNLETWSWVDPMFLVVAGMFAFALVYPRFSKPVAGAMCLVTATAMLLDQFAPPATSDLARGSSVLVVAGTVAAYGVYRLVSWLTSRTTATP